MATYELIALNETTKKLLAPTSADTGRLVGDLSIALGASLALTSGNVGIGVAHASAGAKLGFGTSADGAGGQTILLRGNGNSKAGLGVDDASTYGVNLFSPSDATAILRLGTISTADGTTFTLKGLLTASAFTLSAGVDHTLSEGKLSITDTANEEILTLVSSATTNNAATFTLNSLTTATGFRVSTNSITTGTIIAAHSSSNDTGAHWAIAATIDSTLATGSSCIRTYHDANGKALLIEKGYIAAPVTITAGGTTGAQTINKMAGSVNFAGAATSLVVTNSLVTTNSIIIATVATNDTTMKSALAVAASGSFTIHANAAATVETRVNFLVINKGD